MGMPKTFEGMINRYNLHFERAEWFGTGKKTNYRIAQKDFHAACMKAIEQECQSKFAVPIQMAAKKRRE